MGRAVDSSKRAFEYCEKCKQLTCWLLKKGKWVCVGCGSIFEENEENA
jgi:ribosomal protein L37AE/L43A